MFGAQEGLIDQLHYIDTECLQYGPRGRGGRDDGAEKGVEFKWVVYYLRDRSELPDSGTFWLSETPDKVSRGWDGACNRTVTWVELKDRKSGKEFFYFNTPPRPQARRRAKRAEAASSKDPRDRRQESPGHRRRAINTPVDSPIFKP